MRARQAQHHGCAKPDAKRRQALAKALPGTLPPTTLPYVEANLPNTPDGLLWEMGDDPHTLTAYTSPNTGDAYAVFEDNVLNAGSRSWVAVVNLTAVLSERKTPRGSGAFNSSAPVPAGSAASDANQAAQALPCCQSPDPLTSANPAGCTVRFICVSGSCGTSPTNTCAP